MRLLLRESVENLGTIGDVVQVADGYGRNYLVPKGIGVAVTTENLRLIDVRKQELIEEEAKRRGEAAKIGNVLATKQFTIYARAAGEEGKLYGSVGPADIADALVKEGFHAEPKMVLLDKPIKELGIFEVRLRLFADVEATTKVWVVEDKNEE